MTNVYTNLLHHVHFFYKNKQSQSAPKLPRTKEQSRNIRIPRDLHYDAGATAPRWAPTFVSLGRLLAPPEWPFVPDSLACEERTN